VRRNDLGRTASRPDAGSLGRTQVLEPCPDVHLVSVGHLSGDPDRNLSTAYKAINLPREPSRSLYVGGESRKT
jgi:hypothetical protein